MFSLTEKSKYNKYDNIHKYQSTKHRMNKVARVNYRVDISCHNKEKVDYTKK